MSTILDALAKARQEKEQRGSSRPRIMIKSSPSQAKGHGIRILLLAAVLALSGVMLVVFLRPPWALSLLSVFGFGEKEPAATLTARKPSAPSATETTENQKPAAEKPRGLIEILMKSREMAAKGETSKVSPPTAAPDRAAKTAETDKTLPLFLQKLQEFDASSQGIAEKTSKKPSAITQPADNPFARFLKDQEGTIGRKTGPPSSMPEPEKGLQAAKQKTSGPMEIFNQGVDLEKAGNPQEAAAAYQKVIALDKKFTRAYINLGNLYLNHWEKPWQAISLYRRALESSPDNPKVHNNLGVAYMALEQFDMAEKELQKAADLDEKFVDPVYNLACLFARKGDAATALTWLKKAHELGGAEIVQWAIKDQDLNELSNYQAYQDFLEEVQSTQESLGK